jgi:hypothetical protein
MQNEGLLYLLFINFSYTQHQFRNGLITMTTQRTTLSVLVRFIIELNPKSKIYLYLYF